jgi:hypothetical protein
VSTSAGFGAALLAVVSLHGSYTRVLAAFCATTSYVLVLGLELELATRIRGSGTGSSR